MMDELLNDKAIGVLDLLEQIESTNAMIDLHETDAFMQDQYIHRKEKLVQELVDALRHYDIHLEPKAG